MAAQWYRRQPPFTPFFFFFLSFFSFLFSFVCFVVLSVVLPCSTLHCIHMDTWGLARVFPQPQSFGSLFREKAKRNGPCPSRVAPTLLTWVGSRCGGDLNFALTGYELARRLAAVFLNVHRPQRHDVSPEYQRGYSASRQHSPEQWRPEILVHGPLGWQISSIGLPVARMVESAYRRTHLVCWVSNHLVLQLHSGPVGAIKCLYNFHWVGFLLTTIAASSMSSI